jgi:tRNA 2-selenouridine synthase
MEYMEASQFLLEHQRVPILDVRTPSEYSNGHIPGSVNLPLFSDEERAQVGTIYKKSGREEAIETGLELVGPKLKKLASQGKNLAYRNNLKVYCWRGGMRSGKISWLFELVGIKCYVLKGGIKAYRQQLLKDFTNIKNLVILQGSTGTGKSEILRRMAGMGEQVLDLEMLANHRGSAFGEIGFGPQPTSQQFQNDLHFTLIHFNPEKRIWVESESLTIGKVYLPETLWEKMNHSTLFELEIPREKRIQRLVNEYGKFSKEELVKATLKIRKRFGGNNVKKVIDFLEEGNFVRAADILLMYYDQSYLFSQKKYKDLTPITIQSGSGDTLENAEKIINKANELSI